MDLELFQYYKGLLIGVLIGISIAWLCWRLPVHVRTYHTRKLRQQVLDIHRIETAFKERAWMQPNVRELRVARVPWRERISEWWEAFEAESQPRTPEQVAHEAYQQELCQRVGAL